LENGIENDENDMKAKREGIMDTDFRNGVRVSIPTRWTFAMFFSLLSFLNLVLPVLAAEPDCSGYPAAFVGAGTSGNPYRISSLSDLQCMSSSSSSYYLLENDIDAADTSTWNGGAGFAPIGPGSGTNFTGGFDGANHIISNLFINRPSENAGLFGSMDFNTKHIRNVGLTNVNITGGTYTGGLAGVLDTQNPVENVFVTGSVTGIWPGGLASSNWTDIRNCYTDVIVHGGNWSAGGFVANNYGGDISNSYVNGDVIASTVSRIGAFLAKNDNGTITNSFYNTSSLTLGIGACPSSTEPAFGGCSGQSMTGKTSTEMHDDATFTDLSTTGLSSAWDFVGNPHDDTSSYDYWTIVSGAAPTLATFLGLADQDGDGHNMMNDCDDTNEDVFEIATYYTDEDGDGYGGNLSTIQACGVPAGYSATFDDCDDSDPSVHPRTFYGDADGDGYGDIDVTTAVCGGPVTTPPTGYVGNSTDCDDTDAALFRITTFYPDTDGDGFGVPTPTNPVCGGTNPTAPSGYAAAYGDCDDADSDLYPGSFDGSGTANDPYIVQTLQELACINGTTATLAAYYRLGNDIDASETSTWNNGAGFEPIGPSDTSKFKGGFDGMGHVISNLYINRPTANAGLFGSTDFNTKHIRNVGLTNVNITGGTNTGGLAGVLDTQEPVENVYVTGSVTGGWPGGLASTNWTDIRNSYTEAAVHGGNWTVGGFVAYNYGGNISNSYVNADVTGGSASRVGAFLAKNENGTITNSFYNQDALSLDVGACPSTNETGFGGCEGQEITGKTDAELGLVATFTNLVTEGLSSAWDFVGTLNDDQGILNLWEMATHPVLALFSGNADQDGDGHDFAHDCNDRDPGTYQPTAFYHDKDGDGYGTPEESVMACGLSDAPQGYVTADTDCDDTNANVRPRTFFRDSDADTRGDSSSTTMICGGQTTVAPEGFVSDGTDCDDTDAALFRITTFYPDTDGDGFGVPTPTNPVCGGTNPTAPSGYAAAYGDCDDADSDLYPGSFDGSGTEDDPYVITTLKELACINGTTATLAAYYRLGNDIDASETSTWNNGAGFEPIGPSGTSNFKGGFDGMGHVISNLYINRPRANAGLFGSTDFNTQHIRNIGLENVNITGGTYTGGLAGVLQTNEPVENVYVTGSITGGWPGGLVSSNWTDIRNCYTDVTVHGGNWTVGGFVASNFGGNISDSYVNGDVIGGSTSRIGAFLAKNENGTITNSFYNQDALSLDVSACPATTPGFGGCEGQEITGKTDAELGLVATFTNLVTEGLSSAWDFVGTLNDDQGIRNLWKMATKPILSVFSGEADQDGDEYDFAHDCDDQNPEAHVVGTQYADTDGDGYGDSAATVESCGAPVGYVSNHDDCNDTDKKIYLVTFYADEDSDGYGVDAPTTQVCGGTTTSAPVGYAAVSGDCDDGNASVYPLLYYQDSDGDGYGTASTEVGVCNAPAPSGYVLLSGDGNDADPEINPGVAADITIGSNVIATDLEPLGANITNVAGGTNLATNNLVWGSGFEPGVIRELQRVERTGIQDGRRWMEWDINGGIGAWDSRGTGFLNGATVRFYRLVDGDGNPVSFNGGKSMNDPAGADHVELLGEATIPNPVDGLPHGGFIADEGDGGMKRIYIDKSIDLAFGDYVFIYLKKSYVGNDVITSRLQKYWNPDHPGFDRLWNAKARLVEHPGPIPEAFAQEEPGSTCVRLEATGTGTVSAGQYVYHAYDQSEGMWYSQLHPGAKYRVEAWMRQDGLADDGHARFAFDGATHYDSANQSEPWTVTGEWKKYTYDFIAPAYPSSGPHILHTLEFTGPGTLYVDNWVIYRYDEKHGYEPFGPLENSLDPIMASIPDKGKKPAIRFYPLQYRNASVESMLGDYGDSSFSGNSGHMGSFVGATIAQSIRWAYATGNDPEERVVPWITVPEEYTEVEFKAIIEYLGVPYDPATDTPESKPYAYKRYVQRDEDGTPWTSEFREIVFEYGNETWHQGLGGYGWNGFSQPGYIHQGGKEYGLFAQYMFGEAIGEMDDWKKYDLGSKIKINLGANYSAAENSQTAYGELAVQNTDVASYIGHANYVGPKWETGDTGVTSFNDHGVQETLVGPLVSSTVQQLILTASETRDSLISSGKAPNYRVVAYEGGPSGYWSNPKDREVDEKYGKSLAMGVAALDTWLYSSQKGYGYQNYLGFASGLWWTSHTMPEAGGFRAEPGWLALTMRNRYATGNDMVSARINETPTYSRNGSLLPLVSSYAMRDDQGNYSVFVLSRKLDGSHDGVTFGDGYTPVTLHLPFGSSPTRVTLHKLAKPDGSAADPRDSNRFEENVAIVSQDIDTSNYSTDFVIDENTGGGVNGMPPGTAYLYTFSFCDGTTTCVDADSDGYYATDDCDDSDPAVHSTNAFYADPDGDGYGAFDSSVQVCKNDAPSGYAAKSGDCAPDDSAAYDSASPYYRDADGDGYGAGNAVGESCGAPSGYSANNGDCDDSDISLNPGVAGSCDTPTDNGSDGNGHHSGNGSHKKTIADTVASWISGLGNSGDFRIGNPENGFGDDSSAMVSDGQALQSLLDEATESPDMIVPKITGIVSFPEDGIIRFLGTGTPDSDIVLVVHSETKLVKRIRVDWNGFWRYDHSQKDVFLEPGAHEAYVVAYDDGKRLKSAPSPIKGFEVASSDAGVSRKFAFDWKIFAVIIGILTIAGGAFLLSKRRVKGA
jgi:hypothetical protein